MPGAWRVSQVNSCGGACDFQWLCGRLGRWAIASETVVAGAGLLVLGESALWVTAFAGTSGGGWIAAIGRSNGVMHVPSGVACDISGLHRRSFPGGRGGAVE
ncbi:hypothetical protein BN1263160097 [Stenotrophomonas indicatrix]|nr:hypothetical protein BN1263160097 [Stenotrophomonas indicatrix]